MRLKWLGMPAYRPSVQHTSWPKRSILPHWIGYAWQPRKPSMTCCSHQVSQWTNSLIQRPYCASGPDTEVQIARLADELGKDIGNGGRWRGSGRAQQRAALRIRQAPSGPFHRVRDATLIEDVLVSFKQRPLYKRTMAGEPAPDANRRQRHLHQQGRGRKRPVHAAE